MAVDLLTELRGLHELPMDLGIMIVDGALALAIGLLVAWGIVQAVNPFLVRGVSPERAALRRLSEVGQISGDEGLTARALVLQELASVLPDAQTDWLDRVDRHLGGFFSQGAGKGLRDALYRPDGTFNLARFDSDLKASLERADR